MILDEMKDYVILDYTLEINNADKTKTIDTDVVEKFRSDMDTVYRVEMKERLGPLEKMILADINMSEILKPKITITLDKALDHSFLRYDVKIRSFVNVNCYTYLIVYDNVNEGNWILNAKTLYMSDQF